MSAKDIYVHMFLYIMKVYMFTALLYEQIGIYAHYVRMHNLHVFGA